MIHLRSPGVNSVHPLVVGLMAAIGLFLDQAQVITEAPKAIQDLGGLGTFLLGAAAMGAVVVWAIKNFKLGSGKSNGNGNGGGANAQLEAERRTNAAVKEVIDEFKSELAEVEHRLTDRIDKLPVERRRWPRSPER